jgi:hypothetical protein
MKKAYVQSIIGADYETHRSISVKVTMFSFLALLIWSFLVFKLSDNFLVVRPTLFQWALVVSIVGMNILVLMREFQSLDIFPFPDEETSTPVEAVDRALSYFIPALTILLSLSVVYRHYSI